MIRSPPWRSGEYGWLAIMSAHSTLEIFCATQVDADLTALPWRCKRPTSCVGPAKWKSVWKYWSRIQQVWHPTRYYAPTFVFSISLKRLKGSCGLPFSDLQLWRSRIERSSVKLLTGRPRFASGMVGLLCSHQNGMITDIA